MKRIGILGGGQLGCMLAESLYRLGATVAVYEPDPQAPLCRRTDRAINAPWDDVSALERFARDCDRVTYEFENVESEPLRALAAGTEVWPSVEVLSITQHRGREKRFLAQHGLPHVAFQELDMPAPLHAPCVLKTVRGGYDGKGQIRWSPGDPPPPLHGPCLAEEVIHIEKEVSCIVARSRHEVAVFPVFDNIHRDHILDTTLVPASVPDAVRHKVQELATTAARQLGTIGLLTTEFFLTRTPPERSVSVEVEGWYIFINEFAPRPHNSGHVTRQACTFSQFDALARILLDVPLGRPELVDKRIWGMGNLLGDLYGDRPTLDVSAWADHPEIRDICFYGKTTPRPGRKMGHVVVRGRTDLEVLRALGAFRAELARPGEPRLVSE